MTDEERKIIAQVNALIDAIVPSITRLVYWEQWTVGDTAYRIQLRKPITNEDITRLQTIAARLEVAA